MKIKTITCHNVANYGAALQAYALQTFLESLGHNVEIIDYTPSYMKIYDLWTIPSNSKLYKLSHYSRIFSSIYALKAYISLFPTMKRIKSFKTFNSNFLKLTKNYSSYENLVANPPIADLYIAGSDQIWSTYLKNGKDPAFYCAFGDLQTRRISYAASFGFPEIKGGYNTFVKCMLTGLNSISTREDSGKKIVEELGLNATQVFDPVMLLNQKDWIKLLNIKSPLIKEKYILVYDIFHIDERLRQFSKSLSQKYNLRIVAINDKKTTPYADININNAGPIEFINLIANAEYILADSFHATAFSVIFKKEFYIFYIKENISRIQDFLNNINLSERLNSSTELLKINWEEHEYLINKKINESKSYLIHHTK